MSDEKVALLRAYGAEVVICPTAVPRESPESYYSVAERLSKEIPGAYQPNQYFNEMNPRAHYETTGPEIWEQTGGAIDVLVGGLGTGGTMTGAGRYLREKKPSLTLVGADPEGSLYSGDTIKPYKVEGIGEDFIPGTIDLTLFNRIVRVSDRDSFLTARRITREEGILVGGSAGTAMFAAMEVARDLGDKTLIVVILPDTGRNNMGKIYNDEWMRQNGFLERFPLRLRERRCHRTAEGDFVDHRDVVSGRVGRRLLRDHSCGHQPNSPTAQRPNSHFTSLTCSRLRYLIAIRCAKERASSGAISPAKTASRVRSSALAMCGPIGTSRSLPRSARRNFW